MATATLICLWRTSLLALAPLQFKRKPSPQALEKILTPAQFAITSTVPPSVASHEYDQLWEPGIYVDVVSGEPLFGAADKFDAHCGWPSF